MIPYHVNRLGTKIARGRLEHDNALVPAVVRHERHMISKRVDFNSKTTLKPKWLNSQGVVCRLVSSGLGEDTLVYQSQLQEELTGGARTCKEDKGIEDQILLLKGISRFMGRGRQESEDRRNCVGQFSYFLFRYFFFLRSVDLGDWEMFYSLGAIFL
ncbi:hypothetical protein P167DRAFT_296662 [Morchella conica CCBAS932]|uniref:Uncharacterized protein n=1 Tax=Morchella conica CCBAS932 TaxID=1392247 RepID=A0A3N4KGI6_9PEZI|nr:hypothetical protein P167DRAFT_296662 [Morchella conica CCBAS932]